MESILISNYIIMRIIRGRGSGAPTASTQKYQQLDEQHYDIDYQARQREEQEKLELEQKQNLEEQRAKQKRDEMQAETLRRTQEEKKRRQRLENPEIYGMLNVNSFPPSDPNESMKIKSIRQYLTQIAQNRVVLQNIPWWSSAVTAKNLRNIEYLVDGLLSTNEDEQEHYAYQEDLNKAIQDLVDELVSKQEEQEILRGQQSLQFVGTYALPVAYEPQQYGTAYAEELEDDVEDIDFIQALEEGEMVTENVARATEDDEDLVEATDIRFKLGGALSVSGLLNEISMYKRDTRYRFPAAQEILNEIDEVLPFLDTENPAAGVLRHLTELVMELRSFFKVGETRHGGAIPRPLDVVRRVFQLYSEIESKYSMLETNTNTQWNNRKNSAQQNFNRLDELTNQIRELIQDKQPINELKPVLIEAYRLAVNLLKLLRQIENDTQFYIDRFDREHIDTENENPNKRSRRDDDDVITGGTLTDKILDFSQIEDPVIRNFFDQWPAKYVPIPIQNTIDTFTAILNNFKEDISDFDMKVFYDEPMNWLGYRDDLDELQAQMENAIDELKKGGDRKTFEQQFNIASSKVRSILNVLDIENNTTKYQESDEEPIPLKRRKQDDIFGGRVMSREAVLEEFSDILEDVMYKLNDFSMATYRNGGIDWQGQYQRTQELQSDMEEAYNNIENGEDLRINKREFETAYQELQEILRILDELNPMIEESESDTEQPKKRKASEELENVSKKPTTGGMLPDMIKVFLKDLWPPSPFDIGMNTERRQLVEKVLDQALSEIETSDNPQQVTQFILSDLQNRFTAPRLANNRLVKQLTNDEIEIIQKIVKRYAENNPHRMLSTEVNRSLPQASAQIRKRTTAVQENTGTGLRDWLKKRLDFFFTGYPGGAEQVALSPERRQLVEEVLDMSLRVLESVDNPQQIAQSMVQQFEEFIANSQKRARADPPFNRLKPIELKIIRDIVRQYVSGNPDKMMERVDGPPPGMPEMEARRVSDVVVTEAFGEALGPTEFSEAIPTYRLPNFGNFRPPSPINYGNGFLGVGLRILKKNKIYRNNKMNSWVQHVKDFAAKKGIKYHEALKDPECKATYKKSNQGSGLVQDVKKAVKSSSKKIGFGVVDELDDQARIATSYNSKQLGDNSAKKYISL